jgi:hypothetical protein
VVVAKDRKRELRGRIQSGGGFGIFAGGLEMTVESSEAYFSVEV